MTNVLLRWPEPDAADPAPAADAPPAPADTPADVDSPAPQEDAPPTPEPSDAKAQDQANPYALEEENEDAPPTPAPDENKEEKEPYAITWPEDYQPNEEFAAMASKEAEIAGLDKEAVGKYTAAMVRALQQHQDTMLQEQDFALKEEWGAEYEKNLKTAKGFLRQAIKDGALSQDDKALFESAKGMRIMHSLSKYVGEAPLAGGGVNSAAEQEWARAVMTDPNHQDYNALREWNNPRFAEVNRRFRAAKGGL
jgi:hypothetical protein